MTTKPPDGYETWMDYAVATMDARHPHLESIDTDNPLGTDKIRNAARAELADLRADLKEARALAERACQRYNESIRTVTCAFCGESYPPGTPDFCAKILATHIATCPEHPMRKTELELAALRKRLADAEARAELEAALAARVEAPEAVRVLREAILAVCCDPDGRVCMAGSGGDRKVLQDAIVATEHLAPCPECAKRDSFGPCDGCGKPVMKGDACMVILGEPKKIFYYGPPEDGNTPEQGGKEPRP